MNLSGSSLQNLLAKGMSWQKLSTTSFERIVFEVLGTMQKRNPAKDLEGDSREIEKYIEKDFGRKGFEKYLDFRGVEIELSEDLGQLENLNHNPGYRSIILLEFGEDGRSPENVIKIFLKSRHNIRKDVDMETWGSSNDPASNSIRAAKENPTLFPYASQVGVGKLWAEDLEFDIEIIRQEYIPQLKQKPSGKV